MRRRIIPAPWIYFAAAAIGASIGIALELAFGWTWWLGPIVAFIVTWLGFMATAFGGRSPPLPGQGLRTQIIEVISPDRGERRRVREQEVAFRQAELPLLGLGSSWTGSRWVGGMGRSSTSGPRYSLAHGHPDAPTRRFVAVTVGDPRYLRRKWEFEAHGGPHGGEIQRAEVTVNGRLVEFQLVDLGGSAGWFAVGSAEGLGITIRSEGVAPDEIELVTIRDLEPYLQGTRDLEGSD